MRVIIETIRIAVIFAILIIGVFCIAELIDGQNPATIQEIQL